MKKALIVIPHYFSAQTSASVHDSCNPLIRSARAKAFSAMLQRLHELFGPTCLALRHQHGASTYERNGQGMELDICVVTEAGDNHLLDDLPSPMPSYRRATVSGIDPSLLGFFAHQVIKKNVGTYDWSCYIEDDILIEDPLFFTKLSYFNSILREKIGADILVQPHRYESVVDCDLGHQGVTGRKIYIDYEMSDSPMFEAAAVDVSILGENFRLEPCRHPHAGCFFLDAQQAKIFDESEYSNNTNKKWMTWLDTAATYAVWKTFRIYKPAIESASILEVRHSRPAVIKGLLPLGVTPPPRSPQ